jgi:hypothetical protein
VTEPRCDVSPWDLPREREPEPFGDCDPDEREDGDMCDDGIDGDDSDDDCEGW